MLISWEGMVEPRGSSNLPLSPVEFGSQILLRYVHFSASTATSLVHITIISPICFPSVDFYLPSLLPASNPFSKEPSDQVTSFCNLLLWLSILFHIKPKVLIFSFKTLNDWVSFYFSTSHETPLCSLCSRSLALTKCFGLCRDNSHCLISIFLAELAPCSSGVSLNFVSSRRSFLITLSNVGLSLLNITLHYSTVC